MAFSRQGYWSGLLCHPLLYQGIESTSLTSPVLAGRSFVLPQTPPGKPCFLMILCMVPDGSPKVATEALLHQSRMVLKDNADGKSSQWAEPQAAQLVIHFAWKER